MQQNNYALAQQQEGSQGSIQEVATTYRSTKSIYKWYWSTIY
ncbi:MAG TPA: hypothetical protein VJU85_06240 [Nitrososphaeraceae archaeon]|nr:hypothetical protein [Nitrososphaeraceae archaeon]